MPRNIVLLISSSFPKELYSVMQSFSKNSSTFFSAVNFENSVNQGFQSQEKEGKIDCLLSLSTPSSGWWPKYSRRLFIPQFEPIGNYRFSSYCNLFGLTAQSKSTNKKRQLRKTLKELNLMNDDRLNIVLLEMTSYNLKTGIYAKKCHRNTTISLFIPDVPEHMTNGKKSRLYSFLKGIDNKSIYSSLKDVDFFFPFSPSIIPFCKLDANRCITIEGISNPSLLPKPNTRYSHQTKRIVLFCGSLSRAYNLDLLLDAIMTISLSNVEFQIIGDGDLLPAFTKLSTEDPRVKVYGTLGHDQVLLMQKKADVFVNPRLLGKDYSELSFPSKLLEYLSNCKPTVSFVPKPFVDEYSGLFFEPKGETALDLARAIERALSLSTAELDEIQNKIRGIVLSKGPDKTAGKIMNFWASNERLDT